MAIAKRIDILEKYVYFKCSDYEEKILKEVLSVKSDLEFLKHLVIKVRKVNSHTAKENAGFRIFAAIYYL